MNFVRQKTGFSKIWKPWVSTQKVVRRESTPKKSVVRKKRLIPYCQAICKNNFSAAIVHPPVLPPLRLFPPSDIPEVQFYENSRCENWDCFDFSRCPITGDFPIFIYDPPQEFQNDAALFRQVERVIEYLTQEQHIVQDPSQGINPQAVGIQNLKDTIFLFQTGQNNWSFWSIARKFWLNLWFTVESV